MHINNSGATPTAVIIAVTAALTIIPICLYLLSVSDVSSKSLLGHSLCFPSLFLFCRNASLSLVVSILTHFLERRSNILQLAEIPHRPQSAVFTHPRLIETVIRNKE